MRILLDTHALLWSLGDTTRLPASLRARLADPGVEVFCSAVSAWEIAIKQSLGKLRLPGPAEAWLPGAVASTGFDWLPVTAEDALRVRALPWHHRDPFDRLLVAQASSGFALATADAKLSAYGVAVIWS